MKDLNVALIGCGAEGVEHAGAWGQQSGARLAAVVDENGPRAAALAAQIEGAAAFASWEDLLSGPSLDLVDICLPPERQLQAAAAAIRAGSHVLLELPCTGRAADLEGLLRLADDRERTVAASYRYRFNALSRQAADMLANDDFGAAQLVQVLLSAEPGESGSGLVVLGLEALDLARLLAAQPGGAFAHPLAAAAESAIRCAPAHGGPADRFAATFRAGSCCGAATASLCSPALTSIAVLQGSAGGCYVDFLADRLRFLTADSPVWRSHSQGASATTDSLLTHVVDAIRGAARLECPASHALADLRLLESAA